MTQDDRTEEQAPISAKIGKRRWVLGSVVFCLLLLSVALVIAPQVISSPTFKAKIAQLIAEQTGGRLDFQALGLDYFPLPALEIHGVTLDLPEDQVEGTIATLRVSPELLPLLRGRLQVSRIELLQPDLTLEGLAAEPAEPAARPYSFAALEKNLSALIEPLEQMIPVLELVVVDGRLAFSQGGSRLVECSGLDLQLELAVDDPHAARTSLQGGISELKILQDDRDAIKGITIQGRVEIAADGISVTLEQLSIQAPALNLTGELGLASSAAGISLQLVGTGIDVDALRATALDLAGDTSPTREIFTYLRGGKVAQIKILSHGEDPSALGSLENIQIEGHLSEGVVSIPEIKLDLTEVDADVIVRDGILLGQRISTRLEGSTGRDGYLEVGLAENDDLFKLDLTLSADLLQVQPILLRVVDSPVLIAELEKVTNLKGTGHGRLILGDSLGDVNARVEVSSIQFSADYQRVPLPISVSAGQFTFSEAQLAFQSLAGSMGQSRFSELSYQVLWKDDLSLDITSGQFSLNMTELYPWLAAREELREPLEGIAQLTGGLELAQVHFKGVMDYPSEWQYNLSGSVDGLSVDTELLPGEIKLKSGNFRLDNRQLSFDKLEIDGSDASLDLSGRVAGLSRELEQVDFSLSGQLGPDYVAWFWDALEMPETYLPKAPLSISGLNISWQPTAATSLQGTITVADGPVVSADADYRPRQLQVHRATVKDRLSDARIALIVDDRKREFSFSGKLDHATLASLFVNHLFDDGRLEGDLAISVPQTGGSQGTSKGQLHGEDLRIVLPSGEPVAIEQVELTGAGPLVNLDITQLTWRGFSWEPVVATVAFDQRRIDIDIAEAWLCGIDSPGTFSLVGDDISLDMTLKGEGLDVASSYACLTEGRVQMTGTLNLSSRISYQGKAGALLAGLQGPLEMNFSDGVVSQDRTFSRMLEVINVTEIVKGKLPDLNSQGFAYTTISLKSRFEKGQLLVEKFQMDGESLDLLGQGHIDLLDESIDIELMAAPLKTVDSVIKHIPGINYLLAGSLVAIPVSIRGDRSNPKVKVMSASSVGSGLLGLGERVIKSPIKLIETITPGEPSAD